MYGRGVSMDMDVKRSRGMDTGLCWEGDIDMGVEKGMRVYVCVCGQGCMCMCTCICL